jgi:flagellar hook protein FlgE
MKLSSVFFFLFMVCTIAFGQTKQEKKLSEKKIKLEKAYVAGVQKENLAIVQALNLPHSSKSDIIKESNDILSLQKDTCNIKWISEVSYVSNYDVQGRLIAHQQHYAHSFGILNPFFDDEKYEIKYDKQDREISKTFFAPKYDNRSTIYAYRKYHRLDCAYDQRGNKICDIQYEFDSETDSLSSQTKGEHIYDDENRRIATISSVKYNGNKNWVLRGKVEYVLNDSGKILSTISYAWNRIGAWGLDSKKEIEYDSRGYEASVKSYDWKGDDLAWVIYKKDEYRHFDKYKLYLDVHYNWDKKENRWKTYEREESEFDQKGNELSSIRYYKELPFKKKLASYDTNGNELLVEQFNYSKADQSWIKISKIIKHYNLANQQIFYQSVEWNQEKNRWITNKKEETVYNTDGNKILEKSYALDDSLQLFLRWKSISIYDSRQNKIYSVSFVRQSSIAPSEIGHVTVSVFNDSDKMIQSESYDTDNEKHLLQCFFKKITKYDPSHGKVYELEFTNKGASGVLSFRRVNETSYVDYFNDEKEINFIECDLAVGVEVKEKRKIASQRTYYYDNYTNGLVIYNKLENEYNKSNRLVKCTLYQNDN